MKQTEEPLSRRFREIMDLAYRHGHITARLLEEELSGSPSNSTVRTQLRVLEGRGYLKRFDLEGSYAYRPSKPRSSAAQAAMRRFLKTFADGSAEKALTTLLSAAETDLTDNDFERLEALLKAAREKGKSS